MSEHLGISIPHEEVAELERNVAPEAVLDALERDEQGGNVP
jgi:hypothetical protein